MQIKSPIGSLYHELVTVARPHQSFEHSQNQHHTQVPFNAIQYHHVC